MSKKCQMLYQTNKKPRITKYCFSVSYVVVFLLHFYTFILCYKFFYSCCALAAFLATFASKALSVGFTNTKERMNAMA